MGERILRVSQEALEDLQIEWRGRLQEAFQELWDRVVLQADNYIAPADATLVVGREMVVDSTLAAIFKSESWQGVKDMTFHVRVEAEGGVDRFIYHVREEDIPVELLPSDMLLWRITAMTDEEQKEAIKAEREKMLQMMHRLSKDVAERTGLVVDYSHTKHDGFCMFAQDCKGHVSFEWKAFYDTPYEHLLEQAVSLFER